jgi:hypothetical protein
VTSDELNALFRSEVGDTMPPYFWSDAEVYAYIDDAYSMFVRLTGGVADFTTSSICEIDASKDEPTANVSPKILRFVTAHRRSDGREVKVLNYTDMNRNLMSDYGVTVSGSMPRGVGKVRAMVIGLQKGTVRWIDIPDADDTIDLVVYRLPLSRITGGNQQLIDVDEEHHLHLLKWAKSLAYRKHDDETDHAKKADGLELQFRAYCELAKRELDLRKHKVRVVSYGGL